MLANPEAGEVLVQIDGEPYIMRCTLGARERLIKAFDLDRDAEEIDMSVMVRGPNLATTVACLLVGTPKTADELLECHMPVAPTQTAVMEVIRLGLLGPLALTQEGESNAEGGTSEPS